MKNKKSSRREARACEKDFAEFLRKFSISQIVDGGEDEAEIFHNLVALIELLQGEATVPLAKPEVRVIVNYPATVLVVGREKTVVKVHDEDFDLEKGIAMAILKHCGLKRSLFKELCASAEIQCLEEDRRAQEGKLIAVKGRVG